MLDNLSPDTSLALIQKDQNDLSKTATSLQKSVPHNMQAIEEAAQEFEAVFISEMLKPMFKEIKTDPLFGGSSGGGGAGQDIYKGMMLTEYGKMIAETGTIGLSDQVKAELLRIQEETQ